MIYFYKHLLPISVMTISPNQEMAFRLTELYLKHFVTSTEKREISIDDVVDKYHYVLEEVNAKSGNFSTEVLQDNMSILPGIPEVPIEYSTETPSITEDDEDIRASDLL